MSRASILNFVKKNDDDNFGSRTRWPSKGGRSEVYFTAPKLLYRKESHELEHQNKSNQLWRNLFLNIFNPYDETKQKREKDKPEAKKKESKAQKTLTLRTPKRENGYPMKNKCKSWREKATEEFDDIMEKPDNNHKPMIQRNNFRRRSCHCNHCGQESRKLEKTKDLISINSRIRKAVEITGLFDRVKPKLRSLYKSKSFLYRSGYDPRSPLKSKKKSLSPGLRNKSDDSREHQQRSFLLSNGSKSPSKRTLNSKDELLKPLSNSITLVEPNDEKSGISKKSEILFMQFPFLRPTNIENYVPILDRSRMNIKKAEADNSNLSRTERDRALEIASANMKKRIKLIKFKRPAAEAASFLEDRPISQIKSQPVSRNGTERQPGLRLKGAPVKSQRVASWHNDFEKSRKEKDREVLSIYKNQPAYQEHHARVKSEGSRAQMTMNSTSSWVSNLESKLRNVISQKKYAVIPNTKTIVMLSGRLNVTQQK